MPKHLLYTANHHQETIQNSDVRKKYGTQLNGHHHVQCWHKIDMLQNHETCLANMVFES